MKKIKLYLNHAGFCYAKENEAIQGGKNVPIEFHALWGLILHPQLGWILYDTGYTRRFYKATKWFPNKIYAWATKVVIKEADEVKNQLLRNNISPLEIKHVIITHFHADHIGGLKDFPNATFYTSRAALEHTLKIPSVIAFSKGVLKALLPEDLAARTIVVEDQCKSIADDIFGAKYDLFDDGSVWAVQLPGHAAGQIGILTKTEKHTYFLIADACWLKATYEKLILPHPIVRLFFHSWSDFKQSLNKVHLFHKKYPNARIVPTHCLETTINLISDNLTMDEL